MLHWGEELQVHRRSWMPKHLDHEHLERKNCGCPWKSMFEDLNKDRKEFVSLHNKGSKRDKTLPIRRSSTFNRQTVEKADKKYIPF